jgi:YbbR domain-containing protein
VTPEQVRAPFGVEVVQVTPSTVALALESSVTRDVPVVASIEGMPAPGFVVGKVTVSPERVEIVGPESAVKRAREALTETISIADLHDPLSQDVTIGLIDPALRVKAQRMVTVTVQIVPGPLERTVRSRPIHLRNLGPRLSAQAVPVVVDVGLRGSREALTRIDADTVTAYIDVVGLGAGDYTLAVHAEASNQAGVTHIDPATVQVRIASAKE